AGEAAYSAALRARLRPRENRPDEPLACPHRDRAAGRARPHPGGLRLLRALEGLLPVGRLGLGPDDRVHGAGLGLGLLLAAQQDAAPAGEFRAERALDRPRP